MFLFVLGRSHTRNIKKLRTGMEEAEATLEASQQAEFSEGRSMVSLEATELMEGASGSDEWKPRTQVFFELMRESPEMSDTSASVYVYSFQHKLVCMYKLQSLQTILSSRNIFAPIHWIVSSCHGISVERFIVYLFTNQTSDLSSCAACPVWQRLQRLCLTLHLAFKLETKK